jgi:Lrp/AsnC family leucine-responsive transcriptional regulator
MTAVSATLNWQTASTCLRPPVWSVCASCRSGYILGYTAQLNPHLLDVALLVFIEVVLDRTTPDVFDAFRRGVQAIPEVLECHMVAGGFDYLVKARVKDMNAYRDFLGKSLLQLNGVRETHTYAVMEEVKNTTCLPIK